MLKTKTVSFVFLHSSKLLLIMNKEEESDSDIRDNESVYSEYDLENKIEKINENDDDEDTEDKIYVISLNGSPHFYESNLVSARATMWKIANKLLKTILTYYIMFNII